MGCKGENTYKNPTSILMKRKKTAERAKTGMIMNEK